MIKDSAQAMKTSIEKIIEAFMEDVEISDPDAAIAEAAEKLPITMNWDFDLEIGDRVVPFSDVLPNIEADRREMARCLIQKLEEYT